MKIKYKHLLIRFKFILSLILFLYLKPWTKMSKAHKFNKILLLYLLLLLDMPQIVLYEIPALFITVF